MRRESHVRFCEGPGVKFPRATRLVVFATPVVVVATAFTRLRSPGRDGPFGPPPGQNPASGFPAPGSHFGSTEWSCPDLADRFDCLNQAGALVSNSMGDT